MRTIWEHFCSGYPPGSISGRKWEDLNGNGIMDTSEPKRGGWEITCTNGTNTFTNTTASDGTYLFSDLAPSTYTISEESKSGWVQTYPLPLSPGTWSVALTQYQTVTNKDFGNYYCNLSVSIDTPDKQLNCTGPCPIITATVGGIQDSDALYQWYNNSEKIADETSKTFVACYPGSYTFNVTNTTTGCKI